MDDDKMTPARAEAITSAAAAAANTLFEAAKRDGIAWPDLIAACALAARGIAAHASHEHALPVMETKRQLFDNFMRVVTMPDELIKIVPGYGPNGEEFGIIPVMRQ